MKWKNSFLIFIFLCACSVSSAKVSFSKGKIKLSGKIINVEIADTPEEHAQGLMNRSELKQGSGMLFVFPSESERSFWMKNTFIGLSIGYFDKNRVLFQILDMVPSKSIMEENLPSYPSKKPAMYALEVPVGWFNKNNIKSGAVFTFLEK